MPSTPASSSRRPSRRRGEEHEHAARCRRRSFRPCIVGAHHVALGLRHLRAVLDHHALREQARGRLVVRRSGRGRASPWSRSASRSGAGWRARRRRCTGRSGTSRRSLRSRTAPCRCARRSSGRNTRTNRRTCPSCRSRAGRRRRTSGTSTLTNSGTFASGERPVPVISTFSGSTTGSSLSGTGTTPHFGQWITGIGVPQ